MRTKPYFSWRQHNIFARNQAIRSRGKSSTDTVYRIAKTIKDWKAKALEIQNKEKPEPK